MNAQRINWNRYDRVVRNIDSAISVVRRLEELSRDSEVDEAFRPYFENSLAGWVKSICGDLRDMGRL